MRGKVIAVAVVVAAFAAIGAPIALAEEGAAKSVGITMNEWGIHKVPKTVKAGTPIKITVSNTGGVAHELVLEKAGCAKQCPLTIKGHHAEVEGIKPGTSRTVTWTITKPGNYTFTCRLKGHYEAGMKKTFKVV
jgi:uncharacterized cupredoxin-like copper-binding protein